MEPVTICDEILSRERLWVIVAEAAQYLDTWMNDKDSRQHPTYGEIRFNTDKWRYQFMEGDNRICEVCLAGLWALRKEGTILQRTGVKGIPYFLDSLRRPSLHAQEIEEWLGVTIPNKVEDTIIPSGDWHYDPRYCGHILLFLNWLLQQQQNTSEV